MKKHLLIFASLMLTISAFIVSCSEEDPIEFPTPESNTLKDFFKDTRVQSQFFTFDAAAGTYFFGAKGTGIYFPGGSLLHQNGTAVTGTVQLELKEIYSKGDMILSNAAPESNGTLLKSGGEVYVALTQNNQKLRISHTNPGFIMFPCSTAVAGMQLFNGEFRKNSELAADSAMNWNLANGDSAQVVQDTMGTGTYYQFTFDSIGWSNCDRFYYLTGGTDPMIHLPNGYDNMNTQVYMVFDAESVMASADVFADQIYRFHAGEHTPIGLHVTIVAIANTNDKYYYSITHEVTSAGATFELNLTEATKQEVQTAISAL